MVRPFCLGMVIGVGVGIGIGIEVEGPCALLTFDAFDPT